MCGLFGGISSELKPHHISAIKLLGILSQLRGDDSTGIATVTPKKRRKLRWLYHKELGNSSKFFDTVEARELLKKEKTSVVLGHTRLTTCGHTNLHNAHPIMEKQIIGCHNGVIHSLKPEKGEEEFTTDSRKLFQIIADHGLEEGLVRSQHGGMALAFIDKKRRTLNLFRNNSRDLYITSDLQESTFLWASEERFLEFVLDRERLHLWKKPQPIESYKLYSWKIGSNNLKPLISDVQHRPMPITLVSPGSAISNRTYDYMDFCTKCWELKEDCLCEPETMEPPPWKSGGLDEREYIWFSGQISPAYVIEAMLEEGCFGCRKQFRLEDRVIWPHWDYYICNDCSKSEFYRMYLGNTVIYEGRLVSTIREL